MKFLKLILDGLTSAAALFVFPTIMIVVMWPYAGHWISFFWLIVLLAVLLGELLNKFFSPDKRTVSSNIRTEVKKGGWRVWVMLIMWLAFSLQLFFHFIKPVWLQ